MTTRKTKASSTSPVVSSPSLSAAKTGLPALEGLTDAQRVVDALAEHGLGNWKAPGGTDKEQLASGEQGPGHHSYGAVYQAIIAELEKRGGVKSVLEIGVQRGGSLYLWQKLCKQASVVGIDIKDQIHKNVYSLLDKKRVETLWGNAYAQEMIGTLQKMRPSGFSLIIDDGPHSLESQKDFISLYLPLLSKGGIAVIEDIQDEQAMKTLVKEVPSGYKAQTVDRRSVNGRWDDLMLVIERV